MTGPKTGLASLEFKDPVRLRWTLHDIKSKRTEIVPVSPVDLRILIDMDLALPLPNTGVNDIGALLAL
jgi:hypothetical protein